MTSSGDVEVHLYREDARIWAGGEARKTKIILDSTNSPSCPIRRFFYHCIVYVLGERYNESFLSRVARL